MNNADRAHHIDQLSKLIRETKDCLCKIEFI